MTARRSPALARLPRADGPNRRDRVKLHTTWRGGKSRPVPQRFCQLTVPAAIGDVLPTDAVFEVSLSADHRTLTYRIVDHA